MEQVKCDICGENSFKILTTAEDTLLGLPGRFPLVECLNCGFVFINPRPTKEEIGKYYPNEYGPHQLPLEKPTRSLLNRLARRWYLLFVNKEPYSLKNIPKGKILDVGCGSGEYLKRLYNEGWDTYGVDISSNAIVIAREAGIENTFCGELPEASFPEQYFNVICMKASLEHIHNPSDTLDEVHRILKEDGCLIIGVPNFSVIEGRVFYKQNSGSLLDAPRTLNQFTEDTMRLLLAKTGFTVTKFINSSHPGLYLNILNYLTRNLLNSHHRVMHVLRLILAPLAYIITGISGQGQTLIVLAKKSA